jgi:hypothetical protein
MSDPITLPTPDEIAVRIRACRAELAALKKLQRMVRTAQAAREARERRPDIAPPLPADQGNQT